MSNYRTSQVFARLADAELGNYTQNIITKLTGNENFPKPLVSVVDLTKALDTFTTALAAAAQGGKLVTAAKNAAREVLLGLLRQQAAYVQSLAGDDLPMLLSSGFEAVNTNRTQVPLTKPVIDEIRNDMSTQLGVRVQPVPTARAYEVRLSYGTSGWQAAGIFTQARGILLENLTPGTIYTVQTRAIGGSTGYSDWSDPVSHMAM